MIRAKQRDVFKLNLNSLGGAKVSDFQLVELESNHFSLRFNDFN